MVVIQKPSHSWWFHSHDNTKRSSWLHSTLSVLDEKTMAMLKLIEEDADSFGKRAEMYYKKRPELINMVEDFYRTHRSLAERFYLLKSELKTPSGSARLSKSQPEKFTNNKKKVYDSYWVDISESGESDVHDTEEQEEPQVEEEKDDDSSKRIHENEILNLRKEIERLNEENRIQKEQLLQKDGEKREVIRQLSMSMEILRENSTNKKGNLRKKTNTSTTVKQEEKSIKKRNGFEFNKLKGLFTGKFCTGPKLFM